MFFGVLKPLKINKKTILPCICYAITEENESLVNDLVSKGLAFKYTNYTYFANGKPVEIKEVDAEKKEKKKK